MSMLIVNNLKKSYGKHQAVKDISFAVETGEIVGFIGPNGSGKSTTMKCIASLIFPDSGEINVAGYDLVKSRNQALSHLSALIEAPGLFFNLSGIDNLHLFAGLKGISPKRVQEVAEFTGLGPKLKMRTSKYSMGMKQRLALGIAILSRPTFLILDEPFSGLDPNGIFELREVIKQLAADGCGIIFSSHQLLEMDKIADRNIFIKEGSLVSFDTQLEASMLVYRIAVPQDSNDLTLLNSLKEASVITDFQQNQHSLLIYLTSSENLSPVLTAILETGRKITGITPLTTGIENIYSTIYQQGV